jgi:hypothetical protein
MGSIFGAKDSDKNAAQDGVFTSTVKIILASQSNSAQKFTC